MCRCCCCREHLLRVHTGQVFMCFICGQSFKLESNLHSHITKHLAEKPRKEKVEKDGHQRLPYRYLMSWVQSLSIFLITALLISLPRAPVKVNLHWWKCRFRFGSSINEPVPRTRYRHDTMNNKVSCNNVIFPRTWNVIFLRSLYAKKVILHTVWKNGEVKKKDFWKKKCDDLSEWKIDV